MAFRPRIIVAAIIAAFVPMTTIAPVFSATLLMFESSTCEWCERWHKEIGPAYPKTPYAKIAPLKRVDIDGDRPERYRSIRGIMFTPTFVLWHDGKEVGRLVGYPGEDFFWPLLGKLVRKLPASLHKQMGN